MAETPTLIIGIGSPHGDDQSGWQVVDALRSPALAGVQYAKLQHPSELLDIDGHQARWWICDACRANRPIGQWYRWEWPRPKEELSLEWPTRPGSHDVTLPYALELAQRLGRQPRQVVVWSIAIAQAIPGQGLSPEVARAVQSIARAMRAELKKGSGLFLHGRSPVDA